MSAFIQRFTPYFFNHILLLNITCNKPPLGRLSLCGPCLLNRTGGERLDRVRRSGNAVFFAPRAEGAGSRQGQAAIPSEGTA